MAGAGFKDFAVGEVLTASDVDTYLMQQTVMRFADAAARGTALGTAVGAGTALAEGMVSYLDDANRAEIFDGTSWVAQNIGIGTNVVGAYQTTTQTTTSTSFQDSTSLSVTITPTSSSNDVLILAKVPLRGAPGIQDAECRIVRDNSAITVGGVAVAFSETIGGEYTDITFVFVDSPATTSAVTYKVQYRTEGASGQASLMPAETVGSLVAIEVTA